ncbi:Sporulation-specific protein [Wickerhamomyces ciferrii]|uniref:Sporulation-specific protein n=1 Tax=Wickerhamomyces ciferrii (strain ATCC 14091 / BCRC 22168 / CBS 111 / JCM 3599 / NBRC 0793 / NRRL Y-1031 F-60-10) TaxID=1206466 RepID=K0L0B1_WICCF|nr:Sporulation-specific protein [Wickerhamomyces ciferrii]CCH46858.1 Sporulation-specific protein [Wickerhamomyces ciferrii]
MSESIQKIVNDNYITKLRKESKVLTHIYNYPIIKEIDDYILSIFIFNYFATLFSKLIYDFKKGVLEQYFKFIVDGLDYIDGIVDIYILSNLDHYIPLVKSTHLKDLYPWVLADNIYKFILNKYKEIRSKVKPVVEENTNSVLKPINSNWSKLNDQFLPKTVESIIPEQPINNSELNKSYNLTHETFDRSKKLIENKFNSIKNYPTKISKLFNENLSKSDQNIPKALANTSLEISNKTLSNLGLKPNETSSKINGNGNGNGASSSTSQGSNSSQINGNIPTTNGEVSVGA